MTSKLLRCDPTQLATLMVEAEFGKDKAYATSNGYIRLKFDELNEGCNEIQAGTWSVVKNKITVNMALSWEEALEHMRNKTKPKHVDPIHIDISKYL